MLPYGATPVIGPATRGGLLERKLITEYFVFILILGKRMRLCLGLGNWKHFN